MNHFLDRIKLLATGKAIWCNAITGEPHHTEKLDWRCRWAIAGTHPLNWRLIYRLGGQPCGCVRNPFTRRMAALCLEHAAAGTHDCTLIKRRYRRR